MVGNAPSLERIWLGKAFRRPSGSIANFGAHILVGSKSMLINAHNPFKGRQFPGEVIVLCVRLSFGKRARSV